MTDTAPCATPPDPGRARTLDDLVDALRSLKVWAGDPSYGTIRDRVNTAWTAAGRPAEELTSRTTVADCFRAGRRRLNHDLVLAIVEALQPDVGYVTQWRQALRVIGGEVRAVSQVRVQDALPDDLAVFTGRSAELRRLCAAARGGTVVISAIEGMAGVGKTRLAVRVGQLLDREEPFETTLFVNLRGFHPDPAQPPADPAAVLDGFLRLLGVPAQNIPHDLDGRTRAYQARLAGTRTLVVLDNAAGADQVRPLLPDAPGCPVLVTSRRDLTDLPGAVHVAVDVFTPREALDYLTRAVPRVAVGEDPAAAARIADRCGYLPLALGLVAGHVRNKPGWTLTDHADWLDECHRDRRLDTGVDIALGLSYRNLPTERRSLLRRLALHPAQDFDAHVAAALAGTDLDDVRADLDRLRDDHLLQQNTAGRYTFHDLVRLYATARAHDEDRPAERRAALTRLLDHYLLTAAAAMDLLHPTEALRRPKLPPPGCPAPFTDAATARTWLDGERPNLVTVGTFAARDGWPAHAVNLSATLYRYLDSGHYSDGLAIHRAAVQAARDSGDRAGRAHGLLGLGNIELLTGRMDAAAHHLRIAAAEFARVGDDIGQARALSNLGIIDKRLCRYGSAVDHHERALALYREAGDRTGEAGSLINLGTIEQERGHYDRAARWLGQSLLLCRRIGDRNGEAIALNALGDVDRLRGRPGPAADLLREALDLYRHLGSSRGEAWVYDSLGWVEVHHGSVHSGAALHARALRLFRDIGDRHGEGWALNGLGEAARADGRPADALELHRAALAVTEAVGALDQQGRAHTGMSQAFLALDDHEGADAHRERALAVYRRLGASTG